MTERVCIDCQRPVVGRIQRCRDCVAALRRQEDYRAKAIARDGRVCAHCPAWWNATTDRFYAWRRQPHPAVLTFVLWLFRVRRVRYVEVDHVRRLADGGSHAGFNLQILCRRHHARKTRSEGWKRRRRFDPRLTVPGLLVVAAFLAGVASPPHVNGWVFAGAASGAVLCVAGAVLVRLRARVLSRLWNAELVGLPKVRVTSPWKSGSTAQLQVPTGWGRGLRASRWGWHRIPGTRLVDRLPRYQPDRIVVRHRDWHLDDAQRREAEEKVSDMLGRTFRGRWDSARDRGVLEPLPPLPDVVAPLPFSGDDSRLMVGIGEAGPAGWDTKAAPHLLVVGATGSGKSATLRATADAALSAGWSVSICDPKRIEMRSLRDRVENHATSLPDILDLIAGTVSIMEDRYVDVENGTRLVSDLDPLLLIIDEVAELVDVATAAWRNGVTAGRRNTGNPPVLGHLSSLARLGRSARVHLAAGIQRPDTRWLEGAARDQYGCRVACGPLSLQGSQMVFGDGYSGRAVEPVPGRVLIQTGGLRPVRVQVAWVPGEPAMPVAATAD